MHVGRVAQEHARTDDAPEIQVIEEPQHHALHEGEIEPSSAQLGEEKLRVRRVGVRVTCQPRLILVRRVQRHDRAQDREDGLDGHDCELVDPRDSGRPLDGRFLRLCRHLARSLWWLVYVYRRAMCSFFAVEKSLIANHGRARFHDDQNWPSLQVEGEIWPSLR